MEPPMSSQLLRSINDRPKMVKMLNHRCSCWRLPICGMTSLSADARLMASGCDVSSMGRVDNCSRAFSFGGMPYMVADLAL
jgi:hypothetical protein